MAAAIKGITIKLAVKEQIKTDEFNRPIYESKLIDIENVIVTPINSLDVSNELNVFGKTIAYELCIPKGDKNNWVDTYVEFFDQRFLTVGHPEEFIESMLPLSWNKKVRVERYD